MRQFSVVRLMYICTIFHPVVSQSLLQDLAMKSSHLRGENDSFSLQQRVHNHTTVKGGKQNVVLNRHCKVEIFWGRHV